MRNPRRPGRKPQPPRPDRPEAAGGGEGAAAEKPVEIKRLKVVVRLEEKLARRLRAYCGDLGLDISVVVAVAVTAHLQGFHTVHRRQAASVTEAGLDQTSRDSLKKQQGFQQEELPSAAGSSAEGRGPRAGLVELKVLESEAGSHQDEDSEGRSSEELAA